MLYSFSAPAAPAIVEISRVSATEIQISWNETEGEVDAYFVKYQDIYNNTEVEVDAILTFYQILGLDPGLAYAVSVAAGNWAGRGNFSMEFTVGCELMKVLLPS